MLGPGSGRKLEVREENGGVAGAASFSTHLGVMVRIRMPMKRFFQSRNRARRDLVRASVEVSVPAKEPGRGRSPPPPTPVVEGSRSCLAWTSPAPL